MQIESLEIKNYRLFRDAKLKTLPRMAVVVGANARASLRCLATPMCSTAVDGASSVRLTAGRT
ncbi:MAG: ATP-binding protein, partial [Actinobacteria bacterium]|nr:ATP-binding protein [Actinomycetota bacterium]